jgi:regulator of cell morphogenesis and NO signaling
MNITEQMTVAEIAATVPASVRVFQRHGIDFCCGGSKPIGAACQQRGISFAAMATAIEAAATQRTVGQQDWYRAPLDLLIDHIVTTFHDPLRHELPRLEGMAVTVADVHGAKAAQLRRVESIVRELSVDLRAHMRTEELVLFPAICAMEQRLGPPTSIRAPIAVMEHDHYRAGHLLAELRDITDGYAAPRWACATLRALYQGLEELEATMHIHVHLENNVLFARALRLRGAA